MNIRDILCTMHLGGQAELNIEQDVSQTICMLFGKEMVGNE